MLDSKKFINELVNQGYTHLCVVPCSFAKNIINECINNSNIEYLPSASEAVACSIAAGLKISGSKPIVIVQSSGFTNMISCITSLLKPYRIQFPIVTSLRTYKDGDSEIQHELLSKNLVNLIESLNYDYDFLDSKNLSRAVDQINYSDTNFRICILNKDTFNKVELEKKHQINLDNLSPRSHFLKILNHKFFCEDVSFVGTTGNLSREMYTFMPDTNNFYMAGNMGGALSLGLGASLTGKKIFVCGGDAEFVMHMGGLTTTGRYIKKIDLTYILFDNQQNKSTGGQNTYQDHLDYISIAKACGFKCYEETIFEPNLFEKVIVSANELNFFHVKCGLDEVTTRPPPGIIKRNSL